MRFIYIISILAIAFASCGKLDYQKTRSGLVYKIYGDKKGELVKNGDYIKFNIENKVNDSVYRSTFGKAPAYVQAVYTGTQYDISELWTKMRKGDSVIVIQSLDTFLKRGAQLPPEIKRGDKLIVTLKVLDVFASDTAAQADQKKFLQSQVVNEKEDLKKYFKEKNIEGLQETPSGAFVKIINAGSPPLIDSGNYVSVMYKGASLTTGRVFDTNMDSSFHHTEPLSFTVNVNPMVQGFTEGVKLLGKGGEEIVYVPSSLGYGTNGNPQAGISPNEHLVFNIKVVDVKDKPSTVSTPHAPSSIADTIKAVKKQ